MHIAVIILTTVILVFILLCVSCKNNFNNTAEVDILEHKFP